MGARWWWPLLLPGPACDRQPPPSSAVDGDTYADTDAHSDTDADLDRVRVVTWNVQELGPVGSTGYMAVQDILARLDGDVVGLNEIVSEDLAPLDSLAAELGYDTVVVPTDNPFGDPRNVMLTRLPAIDQRVWTSADLSGDPAADDLTRLPVIIEVQTGGAPLTVIVQHWKSGFGDDDEFRRAIDGQRTAQAADAAFTDAVVVMGDVNAELGDSDSPTVFCDIPSGMPSAYWLGGDLYSDLVSQGIGNDAFAPYLDLGLEVLDAAQPDGRTGTRDVSGRRIDYLMVSPSISSADKITEVYDTRDDGDSALPLTGTPPDRSAFADASDHFPVVLDYVP